MNLRAIGLVGLMALGTVPVGTAGGKAGDMAMVTFHLETDEGQNPKMVFPQMDDGKQRFFFRQPEVSMNDMEAWRPFPSGIGAEYGAVFQLKEGARRRLHAISVANQGRFLISQANGRRVDGVIIDKPVDDGLIVIWKGLTDPDVKAFDKVLPRIGGDGKKK